MNLHTVGVVISREYTTRVKKKSFLITTFVVPVLFAALCCVPALIMLFNKDEAKSIAVIDQSGIVMQTLQSNDEIVYVDCSTCILDSLKAQLEELPYSGILHISALDDTKSVNVSTYGVKPLGVSLIGDMEHQIASAVEEYRVSQYNIDGLREILDEVKPDIDIKSYTIGEDGEDKISNTEVYMIISLVLGIIIFMFVTMFSNSVMTSVIEEKQSKVVEVLLSSVDAVNLMFGKIIGVAMVALTQFLLWVVLTAAIVSAVFGAIGKDKLMGPSGNPTQMVEQMTGMDPTASAMPVDVNAMAQPSELNEVMQTISSIDVPGIILYFFIFFILGYLLYASMFAAVGSAVENVEDSSNLQMPLTVPLMLAYFLALYSWKAPDSAIAVWGSMIPFTSPIVMLARIPFGVPGWQIAVSIVLLALTFALMGWLSAKIYRVGILTSGKKATWKDMLRWLKQK